MSDPVRVPEESLQPADGLLGQIPRQCKVCRDVGITDTDDKINIAFQDVQAGCSPIRLVADSRHGLDLLQAFPRFPEELRCVISLLAKGLGHPLGFYNGNLDELAGRFGNGVVQADLMF